MSLLLDQASLHRGGASGPADTNPDFDAGLDLAFRNPASPADTSAQINLFNGLAPVDGIGVQTPVAEQTPTDGLYRVKVKQPDALVQLSAADQALIEQGLTTFAQALGNASNQQLGGSIALSSTSINAAADPAGLLTAGLIGPLSANTSPPPRSSLRPASSTP